MSVIDCEKLIALVHKRRAIWDKVKEHSNRTYIEKCWKDISLEMKIEEDKLRKKWKYLRDQFSAETSKLQRLEDESGETQTCKWVYFKSLYFLRDVIRSRPSSGNLSRSEKRNDQGESQNMEINSETLDASDDESKDDILRDEQLSVNADDRDYLVEENSPVRSQTPVLRANNSSSIPGEITQTSTGTISHVRKGQPFMKRIKRLRTDVYTSSILEIERKKLDILAQKTEKRRSNDLEDEDLLFFKSILPHVQKIRPENKLAFRGRIHEIVQEFAYPTNYLGNQYLNSMRPSTPYSSSSVSTIQSVPPQENDPPFISGTFNLTEDTLQ